MISYTTMVIWIISVLVFSILSFLAGRNSMRVIEVKSNETIREVPTHKDLHNFYNNDEPAIVPETEELDINDTIERKRIEYNLPFVDDM